MVDIKSAFHIRHNREMMLIFYVDSSNPLNTPPDKKQKLGLYFILTVADNLWPSNPSISD